MNRVRLLLPAVALLLLAGCFQVIDVLRVNPDGSGTVEENVLVSKKFFAQMNQMMGGFSGYSSAKPVPLELFDQAMLREQASSMGEGVSYRSGKKLETADFTGFTVVYAFTDINRLNLNQLNPSQQIAAMGAPSGDGQAAPTLRFRFTRGSPATLAIEQPAENKVPSSPPPPDAPAAAPAPRMSDEETAKLASMFMGLKIAMVVEVNGTIVTTNAAYRDGNRLTLLELDMDKLGTSFSRLEKLTGLQGGSLGDAREMLKEIPGIKLDPNKTVTVIFDK